MEGGNWIAIFVALYFHLHFWDGQVQAGLLFGWGWPDACCPSLLHIHMHVTEIQLQKIACTLVKSFINYWCNFQRLVNGRLSPWEQVQSCNSHVSGKVMSVKMSQSALDINENMLLDNANGCLQREDAVRFGTSQTIVPIIKRFSENFIDTLRLKTNNNIILGWM